MSRTLRSATALLAAAVALLYIAATQAAPPNQQGLTGAWDRYGTMNLDPRVTSAPPVSAPPLKPAYEAEWEAQQKAAKEADARGDLAAGGACWAIMRLWLRRYSTSR